MPDWQDTSRYFIPRCGANERARTLTFPLGVPIRPSLEARWTHRRWAGRRRGARVRCVRSVRRPAARRRRSSTPRGRGARRVSPPRLPWNHILTRDGTLVADPASSPSRCLSQVTQEGGPAAQDEAGQAEGTRDAPEDGDRGRRRGARARAPHHRRHHHHSKVVSATPPPQILTSCICSCSSSLVLPF